MERVKWIHERLERWAAWVVSGVSVGGGSMFNANRVDQTKDVVAGMRNCDPAFNEEALLTDRSIAALPPDLKAVVKEVYLGEGGMQDIANKLRVTRATLHRRLCNVDMRIAEWLTMRETRQSEIRSKLNYATYT